MRKKFALWRARLLLFMTRGGSALSGVWGSFTRIRLPLRKLAAITAVFALLAFAKEDILLITAARAEAEVAVPILIYHNVIFAPNDKWMSEPLVSISSERLREHFQYMRRGGYNAVTFREYYESMAFDAPLPPKPIIISFDDGYVSNYTLAFPLLKEFNVKASIFVVAGTVGLKAGDGVNFTHFDWEAAREMQSCGLVDIQSHSLTHKDMSKMPLNSAKSELFLSKQLVEENLNKPCDMFAYPYGGGSESLVPLARGMGYHMQILVGNKPHSSSNRNTEAITRITVDGNWSGEELFKRIDGTFKTQ